MAEPISSILKQLSVSLTEVISSLILIFHHKVLLLHSVYIMYIQCCEKGLALFMMPYLFAYLPHLHVSDDGTNFNIRQR